MGSIVRWGEYAGDLTLRQYHVKHDSRFSYEHTVHWSYIVLCLYPSNGVTQQVKNIEIMVNPHANPILFKDAFGNTCHMLAIHKPFHEILIQSQFAVEVDGLADPAEMFERLIWDELDNAVDWVAQWEYLNPSKFVPVSKALVNFMALNGIEKGTHPFISLMAASSAIRSNLIYEPGQTHVDSTVDHVLAVGRGVCQDFTHIMIAIGRKWGVPSRYVSGYLHEDVTSGWYAGAASHAWCEFWYPGFGWIGIDPTNDILAGDQHIRVAAGRDYADVPPTKGIEFGGGKCELSVDVRVVERVERNN